MRVLLSLWHYLYHMWRTLADKLIPRAAHEAAAEEGSDDEEKDTEDETQTRDEKPAGLVVQEPPPIPPPICPAPLQPQHPLIFSRSTADSTITLVEIRAQSPASEQHPHSTPSVTLSRAGETSRTPTPTQTKGKTPLHTPKTLVLDLDETLIHSTSRPMYAHLPGSGLLSGFGTGRRNKGAGHMVEVVLGGRSTLYHVYKRPFVDYFLRKVRLVFCRLCAMNRGNNKLRREPGVGVVHARYIYGLYARVRRSCH